VIFLFFAVVAFVIYVAELVAYVRNSRREVVSRGTGTDR